MNNLQLSKNFSFFELTNSKDFPHLVEENRAKALEQETLKNLKRVANGLLQPVRDILQEPLYILSGFRFEELNSAVGGSMNSQHKRGEAADFTIGKKISEEICDAIMGSDLEWHQMIWYRNRNFIHISLPTGNRDQQFIIKE